MLQKSGFFTKARGFTIALNIAKMISYTLFSIVLLILASKCALWLLPFVMALALAALLDKPLTFIKRKTHLSNHMAAGLGVGFIIAIVSSVLILGMIRLVVELKNFVVQIPAIYNSFITTANTLLERIEQEEWASTDVINEIRTILKNVRSSLLLAVNSIPKGVWNTATSLPQAVIGFIMFLFCTFYFLRDKDTLFSFFNRQLPERLIANLHRAHSDLFPSLFGYIRAILLLSLVSFIELSIGLSLIGIQYSIGIAFLCAVLDALPAIGTGWVLTPWGIFQIVSGNYKTGIAILVLYLIVWFVRQLLEPRVVGNRIGMHPLLLLLAMYIGLMLFGVLGMLLGPLAAITLRSLLRLYFSGRSLREMLYEGCSELPPTGSETDHPQETAGSDPLK